MADNDQNPIQFSPALLEVIKKEFNKLSVYTTDQGYDVVNVEDVAKMLGIELDLYNKAK